MHSSSRQTFALPVRINDPIKQSFSFKQIHSNFEEIEEKRRFNWNFTTVFYRRNKQASNQLMKLRESCKMIFLKEDVTSFWRMSEGKQCINHTIHDFHSKVDNFIGLENVKSSVHIKKFVGVIKRKQNNWFQT